MENYDKYAELTRAGDWAGICTINGVPYRAFGSRKEVKVLAKYLEPDEVVFALSSGAMSIAETTNKSNSRANSWLVALTSGRILFLRAAFLTSAVDVQSIQYSRIQAVSASQGWMVGRIMIDLGARIDSIENATKASVAIFAHLANRWQKELEARKTQPRIGTDLVFMLERLAALHDARSLSPAEFAAAKAKLLAGT